MVSTLLKLITPAYYCESHSNLTVTLKNFSSGNGQN